GVHRRTGQVYPFVDPADTVCHPLLPRARLAWLIAQPQVAEHQVRSALSQIHAQLEGLLDQVVEQIAREFASTSAQEAAPVRERQRDLQHQGWQTTRPEKTSQPDKDRDAEHAGMGSAGKRADDVIGWVQTHLSLPDLIAATHPEVRLRRAGQGWIGWCPFHD